MAKTKVKITDLVLRDAHQSLLATRMVTADMLPIADKLNKVGYWSLETWGGATFDSCIRFLNEDPWERIRQLKKAMPDTQMQMLLRGQNLLGYRHYADDVVQKFVERAAVNGVDVFRIFDALNDPRNLKTSIDAVKKAKKHAQGTISYATSPFHTISAFVDLGKKLKDMGVDSICIKDMAGLIKPYDAYKLIEALKKEVGLPINLHSHATTGMSVAALLKGVEAGADMIDTTISSLSMGTSHSPTETMVEILMDTDYDTGLDIKLLVEIAAYFRDVRKKYKQFESSFLGADTRILLAQVPGGMLSNLESQLKDQGASDKIDAVLDEISVVQKDFGYPPLVTPTSQIVGTQAVFNVLFGRYKNITAESRDLLVGKYGQTAAKPNEELVKKVLADMKMEKAITHRPADDITNEFEKIESDLKEKMGGKSMSIEDVLTYAMFPQVAVKFFNEREKGPVSFTAQEESKGGATAGNFIVSVDGHDYKVTNKDGAIIVDGVEHKVDLKEWDGKGDVTPASSTGGAGTNVESQVAGTILRTNFKEGDRVKPGDTVVIIESMKMELEVKVNTSGVISYKCRPNDHVKAHDILAIIK